MLKTRENIIAPGARAPMRFMPLSEVKHRTGLARSTIFEMVHAGTFPKQFKISRRRIGWLESEVVAWQEQVLASRVGA